jgi:hypothetical protein
MLFLQSGAALKLKSEKLVGESNQIKQVRYLIFDSNNAGDLLCLKPCFS